VRSTTKRLRVATDELQTFVSRPITLVAASRNAEKGRRNKRNRHKHKNVAEFAFCIPHALRRDKLKRCDISNVSVEVPIPLYHFKRKLCVFWYLHLMILVSKSVLARACVYSATLRKWNKLIVPLLFRHVSFPCCYPNEMFIQLYYCLGPISSELECFYSTNTKSSRNNWQNLPSRYRATSAAQMYIN